MTRTTMRRAWLPLALLGLLIVLYAGYFSAYSVAKHDTFQTHMRDLGNMDQPIWNTLHGRFLVETKANGTQGTRLTDHFEPIFALISLAFLIWNDARALLVVQTLFIALGALPVFGLACDRFGGAGRERQGQWMGVLFAGVYLLYPALQAANLTEFHAAPLAVPLLLSALYFGRRGDSLPFWIFSLLSLAVKEEVSLMTGMLGLYLLFFGRRRAQGAALAALSLAWFALSTFVIIPAVSRQVYQGVEGSIYFSRYGEFGSVPKDILLNMLRQPGQVLGLLLSRERLSYLGGLLASGGFLAVLDPLTVLIALPVLMANLLSNYAPMYTGQMHYSAPLVPFFVAGAIGGTGWLADRLTRRWPARRPLFLALLASWILLWGVGMQALRGYTPAGLAFQWPAVTEHHRLLERFAAQIPPQASLSTTPPLFPHFSHRTRIHQFPVMQDADYVLLDVASTTDMHPNDFRQAYHDLLAQSFGIVDAADGYILLRKGLTGATELPEAFYSFVRVDAAQPQYPYAIDFGDSLRFLGYTLLDDPEWQLSRTRTYWQVLRKPSPMLRPYPFYLSRDNNIVEDSTQRPLVGVLWYPPEKWQAGDLLAFESVPWDVGDEFAFCVGALDGGQWLETGRRQPANLAQGSAPAYLMDGRSWARLDTFVRGPALWGGELRRAEMAEEAAERPAGSGPWRFGPAIELLGYELRQPEGRHELVLYWRAVQPVEKDYMVFVHVSSAEGASLPQLDSGPNWRGPLGTAAWHAGEVVPDTHVLEVPADAPAGEYQISVGMYYWESMERLAISDAAGAPVGDEVSLTTLRVGP